MNANSKKKLYKIMSIDGGGVRGIIPAIVMKALEKKFRKKTGNPDAYLVDYLDMVGATSLSSIFGLLLLVPEEKGSCRPKYSAHDACDIFLDYLPRIFQTTLYHQIRTLRGLRDEKYPADFLEDMLDKYFDDYYLSELLLPCTVVSYDIQRRQSIFFTRHIAREESGKDFLVKDVCRASSSAPTYFELAYITSKSGVRYPCIDGAVVANNPSMCTVAEARTFFKVKPDELSLLSLGSGIDERPYFYNEVLNFGVVGWVKPLISFIMSSNSEISHLFSQLTFDASKVPENYLRIDTSLKTMTPDMSSEIDDISPGNIAGLIEFGQELVEKEDHKIEKYVDKVLESRILTPEEKMADQRIRIQKEAEQSQDEPG